MSEPGFVPISSLPTEFKDKQARLWILRILRGTIKSITSVMQSLDVLKDSLLALRDFLSRIELEIAETEGEL